MLKVASCVAASVGCAVVIIAACSSSGDAGPSATHYAVDAASRARGEALMGQMQCTACHAASAEVLARLQPEIAPNLADVGARKTPAALRELLLDPRAARPGSAMPDLLAKLGKGERESTADDLVQFLASLGGPLEAHGVEVDVCELERGRQLFHSVGCVACHAPQESVEDLASPLWSFKLDAAIAPNTVADLGNAAFGTTVEALAKFLVDPLAARPSGRMPSLKLNAGEAHAIATYLLRGQAGAIEELPGWRSEYFEGEFQTAARDMQGIAPIEALVIDDVSKLPEQHREDHFGFRISGLITAPKSGRYEFATRSDDGSMLYVDDKLVIDNDGDHAPAEKRGEVTLERGPHAVTVTMYENAGGEELSVHWKPPGGEMGLIPASAMSHWGVKFAPKEARFVAEPKKVERGRKAFAQLGCAACHAFEGVPAGKLDAQPLAKLSAHVERGCLADEAKGKAPHFELDSAQRASLRGVVADATALAAPRSERETLSAALTRFDCLACHVRDGAGGPNEAKRGYFKAAVEVDLGNEGRLPPHLDRVGSKLYAAAMSSVLVDGAIERPYVATRMPLFGAANVEHLGELFERVDGSAEDVVAPPFSSANAEVGRKLAGTGGLGCIQCHVFDGVQSLGIPAVDLAHVKDRIKPAWFKQLLLDPKSLGMNTRMPVFWDSSGVSTAKTILGGDPKPQVDALWSYLSLGRAMPMPKGLIVPDSEYELTPESEPILCGVFMKDASPRCMWVGTPELVHYAFDIENSRLVCAWKGRFYNAKGTWNGRAGGLEWPQGDDVLEFPKLPPVAMLAKPDDPWPTALGREAGYRRLGYHLKSKLPFFDYEVDGVTVMERNVPLGEEARSTAGGSLVRQFLLTSPRDRGDVYLLVAKGSRIEAVDARWWSVDGRMKVLAAQAETDRTLGQAIVTQTEGGAELRTRATFHPDGARWTTFVEVVVAW
jgi:cytochrome c2